MNSRTKRIFDLCNVGEPEERSPKRSAKNNISECLDTTNDSLFNIMDLPVDINDSFLESLDPKNVNIVDNNLEKKLDAHTTIMTLEQEPSELEDSNVAKFSTVSTVYPDPISHDPSSLVASHSIDSDTILLKMRMNLIMMAYLMTSSSNKKFGLLKIVLLTITRLKKQESEYWVSIRKELIRN